MFFYSDSMSNSYILCALVISLYYYHHSLQKCFWHFLHPITMHCTECIWYHSNRDKHLRQHSWVCQYWQPIIQNNLGVVDWLHMCLESYMQSEPCVKTKLPMQCMTMVLVPEIQHVNRRILRHCTSSDILFLEGTGGP